MALTAMIEDAWRITEAADHELIEGSYGGAPRVIPEAVAPLTPLRSPIMEHRRVERLPPDDARAAVVLPPLGALLRPSALALLVGAPILVMAGWQVAVIAGLGAAAYRELDRRIGPAGFSLGDGFLPYRPQTGWPQGVQEDNDVRWNWSSVRDEPSTHHEQADRGQDDRSPSATTMPRTSVTGAREESRARQLGRRPGQPTVSP